jgi:hypothetical protein
MRRVLLAALAAVPLGVALGSAGQLIDMVDDRLRWAGALGVPWLVVAFAAGAVARERAAAIVAGAVTIVVGTGSYYALHVAASMNLRLAPVVIATGWALAGIACGGAFGWAGAEWRTRRGEGLGAAAAAAAIGGALVGEALLLSQEWSGRAAEAILAAELVAGALLPVLLIRRPVALAIGLTAVAAIVMGVAESEVRAALRDIGWRGA